MTEQELDELRPLAGSDAPLTSTRGRPDRAGAPDRGRADPLLAHATRPEPTRPVPGRERLDEAPELRRDRPVQPESPAPRPPRPAPRSADRRAQSTAARGRVRASLSGAALRRGGDAAASGVARAAAGGARAQPGIDRRRALEPDRVQSSGVASLGWGRAGAPRATGQPAPPRRSPGRPAADLVDDRRVQRAADSPAEAQEPRGRRSRPRQANRRGRVLPPRRAAGRRSHAAGGLAQASDAARRGRAVHGHRHSRSPARRHGGAPRDRDDPADGLRERSATRRAQRAPICLSTRPHEAVSGLAPPLRDKHHRAETPALLLRATRSTPAVGIATTRRRPERSTSWPANASARVPISSSATAPRNLFAPRVDFRLARSTHR